MVVSTFKENETIKKMKIPDFFLFALAVSIDSFSVGITLLDMDVNPILAPLTFAVVSGLFTFTGLYFGNKIEKLLGKIATVIGGIILTIIGISFGF
jgi:putative Mn2+ efflux pump MntP